MLSLEDAAQPELVVVGVGRGGVGAVVGHDGALVGLGELGKIRQICQSVIVTIFLSICLSCAFGLLFWPERGEVPEKRSKGNVMGIKKYAQSPGKMW